MTLVELMVTMVIASIVAASTFMFFAGQQRVYETQTKMLNVQQNGWAAMEVLSRFVRAAGSGMYGCVRPVGGLTAAPPYNRSSGVDPDISDDPPVVLASSAGLDTVHNLSAVPNAGLRARVNGNPQRIPPLWIVDQVATAASTAGIVPGTDVITVAFGNQASGTNFDSWLAANVGTPADAITTVGTNALMFQVNEFILLVGEPGMGGLASDIGCTLFQITGINGAILQHDGTSPWNPGGAVPGTYGAYVGGATPTNPNTGIRNLGQFWWVRFAIRMIQDPNNTSDPLYDRAGAGIPVLTMERLDGSTPTGPQVLAEGIEELQVAYACDTLPVATGTGQPAGDGALPNGPNVATDEWLLNDPNTNEEVISLSNARKCNQPSAVRLTLVARSLTEDNGINAQALLNGPTTIENHSRTCCTDSNKTCCDQFRRRVLSTTVYPRNN